MAMKVISIEKWAEQNEVPVRKAYRWAQTGKLPKKKRKITVWGVPDNITAKDLVKSE